MRKIYYLVGIFSLLVLMSGKCCKLHPEECGKQCVEEKVSFSTACDEVTAEPTSVHIYLDNSVSMKGYVEGSNASFIAAISDLQSLQRQTLFHG